MNLNKKTLSFLNCIFSKFVHCNCQQEAYMVLKLVMYVSEEVFFEICQNNSLDLSQYGPY